MNSFNPPCCPLCPSMPQYFGYQLESHLAFFHHLRNSASTLAKAMYASEQGFGEAMEVLKDVGEMNRQVKVMNHELVMKKNAIKYMNEKLNWVNCKDKQILAEMKVDVVKADQYSQTDLESRFKHEDLENEENQCKSIRHMPEFWEEHVDEKVDVKMKDNLSMVIESPRSVHEEEIMNLQMSLQNQIDQTQTLKAREKTLMDEIESLNFVTISENGRNERLIKQVNVLTTQVSVLQAKLDRHEETNDEDKSTKVKVLEEKLNLKESEMYKLIGNVAQLNSKIATIEKANEQLLDQISRKAQEILEAKESLETLKISEETKILERDERLLCIATELDRLKAEVKVENIFSKEKIWYEKTIANLQMKSANYKEILGVMKESLAGLAAMHEDTSDRLIEAVRNTAKAGKLVVKDVKKQFRVLEKEAEKLDVLLIPVKNKENNNVENNVKNEPKQETISRSAIEFTSSKNAKRVAEDLSWQFDEHFGGDDEDRKYFEHGNCSGGEREKSKNRTSNKKGKYAQ